MKKTVKSLIIAASVAAIAGIGAVSFAAWNAGNVDYATTSASTATIVTAAGELKITNDNLAAGAKLLPWDQVAQIGSNEKIHTFTVGYDAGENGAAAASYTYKMSITNTDNLTLYYQIGEDVAVSDPTEEGTEEAPQLWTAFTGDVTLDLAAGDKTVNIIMVSNDYSADGNGKGYTVTISATAQ